MAQQLFLPNIKGLIPLIDRRKVSEPFVVEGQNFIMDADGPLSGLGRTVVSHKAIYSLGNVQTFKISETIESFIVNNEGIFRFDTESGETILVYAFATPVNSTFPWSMAAVGNKYYFAREDSSLIEYDIVNDLWTTLTTGIPDNIYACTESDGRLVLLTDIWVYWSAIGDGTDFVASTSTGAGAQALTKLGLSNPKPLGIKTVADGFLTFLSSGIMKSHSIISTNPYRHTILSKQHRLVNPYCLTNDEDDNVIFLAKTGLFKTQGEKPQQWQPAMGEYFHSSVIPALDVINNQNNLQIDFDYERSWFSIWVAESQVDYQYTKAFLLNTKIDQWGVLNTPFIALANFYTLPSTFEGFIYGLIDNEGSIYRFDGTAGVEQVPVLIDGYSYYNTWEEIPARNVDDIITFTVHAEFSTTSKLNYSTTGTYYKYNYLQSLISPEDLSSTEKTSDLDPLTVFKENWADGNLDNWNVLDGFGTYTFPSHGFDTTGGSLVANIAGYSFALAKNLAKIDSGILMQLTIRGRLTVAPSPSAGKARLIAGIKSVEAGISYSLISKDFNSLILNDWYTFNSYFKSGVSFGGSGTIADPYTIPSTITVAPYFYANYIDGTGTMEVDLITASPILTFKTNTTFAAGITELSETKQDPALNPLNSFVTIGPIRIFNDEDSDRYSYINNLTIGTLAGAVGDTFDDWNDPNKYPVDVFEDWLTDAGSEDWGFSGGSTVDYDIELVSTLDAITPIEDYIPAITAVNSDTTSDYYACETSGVYHLITISALNSSQNYHIKTLDLSANLGGRL